MADPKRGGVPLESTWLALTHRWAAATGALTALTALLVDCTVRTACLRGGLSWLAVWGVGRAAAWALTKTRTTADPAAASMSPAASSATPEA